MCSNLPNYAFNTNKGNQEMPNCFYWNFYQYQISPSSESILTFSAHCSHSQQTTQVLQNADAFSKYGLVIPIKNKETETVAKTI
jgi:hypothetical protein